MERFVGGVPRSPYAKARQWAEELTREIKGGKYASKRIEWLRSANLSNPVGTAMAWASEANALVCTHGGFSRPYPTAQLTDNSLSLLSSPPQRPNSNQKHRTRLQDGVLQGRGPGARGANCAGRLPAGGLAGPDCRGPGSPAGAVFVAAKRRSVGRVVVTVTVLSLLPSCYYPSNPSKSTPVPFPALTSHPMKERKTPDAARPTTRHIPPWHRTSHRRSLSWHRTSHHHRFPARSPAPRDHAR